MADEYDYLEHWALPSEVKNEKLIIEKIEGLDEKFFVILLSFILNHKDTFAWSVEDLKIPCSKHVINIIP